MGITQTVLWLHHCPQYMYLYFINYFIILIRMPMMGPSVSVGPMPPGQPVGMANKPLFPSAAAIVSYIFFFIYLPLM